MADALIQDMASPSSRLPLAQEPIVIELMGEPRGKGRPRFVRQTGRTYTDPLTVEYERNLKLMGAQAMRGCVPLRDAVAVTAEVYHSIPASWSGSKQRRAAAGLIRPTVKPDCDNTIKMLDALNTVVWLDDKQIVELTVTKHYSTRPRLKITVRPL